MTKLFLAVALIVAGALPVAAQTQNRVEVQRDWAVFEATLDNNKICWIASRPTKSVALRGGKQVQVNRGDIFLMVAVRPADSVKNEISFIAGYPFKKGSKVEAKIGAATYAMSTSGENAWLSGPAEDAKMVTAFKGGVDAVVEGLSARGTTTVDTFSLLGFTAALDSAQKRCK
ncbi:invasion associated locus B family protein [Paralimibaculum aggregatum]|uniref:Invasion associated locus B family protein n=1 Tax=Paralimibaculum aggregatum TaxID=3036245 RepID=A0ABQ6LIS9_9RHOB|nr:invasion associated locus B family protein [Limibaculum sp. NKW23]GMG82059.1 invasion associated locus B family protein [Limibaculum sp. NKW23]